MKSLISRVAACAAVAAFSGSIAGCGAEKYQNKTSGSEATMQRVQQGQPLYTPPANAPIPAGARQGGYNVTPPSQ